MLVGATQLGERDGEISEKRNTQESAVFLRWITDEVVPNRVGLGAAVATPVRRIDVEMSPTALLQGMASAASTSEPWRTGCAARVLALQRATVALTYSDAGGAHRRYRRRFSPRGSARGLPAPIVAPSSPRPVILGAGKRLVAGFDQSPESVTARAC